MSKPKIDSFLTDPLYPCWSSYSLKCALDRQPGDATERVLAASRILDDRVASTSPQLTPDLICFIRDITLYGYARNALPLAEHSSVQWLLSRFRDARFPHRALLIALTLDIAGLDYEDRCAIIEVLRGTEGERFLDLQQLDGDSGS